MVINRKLSLVMVLFSLCLILTACSGDQESAESTDTSDVYGKYNDLESDETGMLNIPADAVTAEAKFFNYDADGTTVQFVALRDSENAIHIAFNTCQSCSPSPEAYYQQNQNALECMNCGFIFEPEEVGITQGGCNPWPVDGVIIDDAGIRIPAETAKSMIPAFESWGGPVK